MRFRTLLIALFFLTCLTTAVIPAAGQSHIKYFGYWDECATGRDCGDEQRYHVNFVSVGIDETPATYASCGSPWQYEWQCKTLLAASRNQKVILSVKDMFFESNFTLRSGYSTRWSTFSSAVQPLLNSVAAFSLREEPFVTALIHSNSNLTQVKSDIETVTSLIQADSYTTSIPLMQVFAFEEFFYWMPNGTLPSGLDWIGFDCYGVGDACADDPQDQTQTVDYTLDEAADYVESLMSAGQRLVLVPDGFTCTGNHPNSLCPNRDESDVRDRIEVFQDVAASHTSVIAIVPFLWQNANIGDSLWGYITGTAELSGILDDYTTWGQYVISTPTTYADTPWFNATVSQNFTVSGWAVDLGSFMDAGMDAVHVWAFPVGGGGGVWIGSASVSDDRPDIGSIFGSHWRYSGYHLTAPTIAAGTYDLVVFGHSSVTQTFNSNTIHRITVQ